MDSIKDGFNRIIVVFEDFPNLFSNLMDKLFNPNSEHLDGDFDIKLLFFQNLPFLTQFQNAIDNISSFQQPLQLPIVTVFGYKIDINGKIFESAVPKIRSGISTLFLVMCALSIWRMISGVFNIHVGHFAGSVAQDNKYFGGRD